jgi:o-succinylbenzoate---CoA ligase
MAFLIHEYHKIAFNDLSENILSSLPDNVKDAATLIMDWESGRNTFGIKTSGSTGNPKNIKLYRDKIEYSARQTADAIGLQPGDTLLCCLGLNYIAGFMMVMRAVVNECNLIIIEPVSNPLREINENQTVDFASFVPLQAETMLQDEKAVKIMNGMKAILLGGGPVSEKLEEKLQAIKATVYQSYAMTETYTHVALRLINGPAKSIFYKPLPGVKLSLDRRGCLVISSILTDDKPLITNDLAELNPDGRFLWLGRIDNTINSGGIKIQLEKIESACQEIFDGIGIKPAFFAAGVPDERFGQKLVIVIEGQKWGEEMIHNFNDQLSGLLEKYQSPKDILFVARILKTDTGKVDRMGTIKSLEL